MQSNFNGLTNNYPFNKLPNHFKNEEKHFNCPDRASHHGVTIINKKDKHESSDEYTTTDWYKINSSIVVPTCANRLYRVIILAGEIFRLVDINDSPKYRVFSEEKLPMLLSKGITNPVEYFTYLIENGHNLIYEGMGRQFFIKYFLVENDNHNGNWYISVSNKQQNHYFYAIDHGQCFAPWVLQFYTCLIPPPSATHLTARDYDSFPITQDYIPKTNIVWYNGLIDFRKIFANQLFINEKHFTALKLLITDKMQQTFVDIHITDENDKTFLKEWLFNRASELNDACKESEAFKQYLHTYRMTLLCVMINEVNEFFNANRHYEHLNINRTDTLMHVIKRFREILNDMKEDALNKTEIDFLNQYLNMIRSGNIDAIKVAQKFYTEQHMSSYVALTQKKIDSMQTSSQNIRFFNLKSPLSAEAHLKNTTVSKNNEIEAERLFENTKIKEIKDRISHLAVRIFLNHRGNNKKRQLECDFLQEIVRQYYLKPSLVNAIENTNIHFPESKIIYNRSWFFNKRNKTLDLINTITSQVKKI